MNWSITCDCMGESSQFPKSCTFKIQILKLEGWLQKWIIQRLNDLLWLDNLKTNQRSYYNLLNLSRCPVF